MKLVDKPESVASDPWKSAKWDELTAAHAFDDADAPALAMLVEWYRLADLAMDELSELGGQTAYQTEQGNLRALPQISTLSTCSIRIAQLEDRLGIHAARAAEEAPKGATVLEIVQGRREERAKRATGA